MSEFSQGHALVVGVGADLPNTIDDAKGLAELLQDPERCAYPAQQVTLLTGENAKRPNVLDALDQLAQNVDSTSTVVVYFSGHGYELTSALGKQYFLMPYGYDINNILGTAIGGPEFMAKLQAIKAQKMLILLDCCHAGGMDDEEAKAKAPGMTFTKAPLPPEAERILGEGKGRVIIASSQADQKSYTGKPYSQFTQALLEALTGQGASKKDGFAKAADLAMYTARTVPKYTKERQIPVLNFDKADNFAVAYYAGGDAEPKGLPEKSQRQPMDDVEDEETAAASVTTNVTNSGSGGVAVGDHNRVAGERGVVADNVHGDIMTGDGARKINTESYIERQENRTAFDQSGQTVHGNQSNVAGDVNTGGGAFTGGSVHTGGGDFVGRDKNISGDEVRGDKIGRDKITTGNITGNTGVAIGRNARVQVGGDTSVSIGSIVQALEPIRSAAQNVPDDKRAEAIQKVDELQAEVVKGENADDDRMGDILDDLAQLLPDAARAIGAAFGQPLLAGIAGPVTKFVLRRLGIR